MSTRQAELLASLLRFDKLFAQGAAPRFSKVLTIFTGFLDHFQVADPTSKSVQGQVSQQESSDS